MPRTSIVLLIVALGLTAFIVFFERDTLSTSEREGRKGRVLESFMRERVTHLELQRHGVTTSLVKVAPKPDDPLDVGGWHVEAPYRAAADQNAVDGLLESLEWAEARRSLGAASPKELEQFGLDNPRYRLSFDAGGMHAGLSVGVPAAAGGGSYLKLHDRPEVYVVGADLLDALEHAPEDFHDKNMHDSVSIYTLERLKLTAADSPERQLARRDGLVWLDAPFKALAGAPAVTALMDTLDATRAARYVGESAKPEFGLQQPRFVLALDSLVYDRAVKDKRVEEHLELRVGAVCAGHAEEAYVQIDQKSVYCVSSAELKKLDPPAEALRETRTLPIADRLITAVQVVDSAHARELALQTNDQGTRYRVSDHGREVGAGLADAAALTEWYEALRALPIASFDALSAERQTQLEKSALVATFQRGKDEKPYVLHVALGSEPNAPIVAVRDGEPALIGLPQDARALFAVIAARFRAKRVLDEKEAQFSALTLTQPGSAALRVVKGPTGYTLAPPLTAAVDSASVDELLRMVSKLDALSFVADVERPEHGLDDPFRTLLVEYTENAKTRAHTLIVGAKSAELGRFAKFAADPAVFVVPSAFVQRLEAPLATKP
ncbi:MAG: hypothetical protein RL701_6576 [Pseudomonadota bacterium]